MLGVARLVMYIGSSSRLVEMGSGVVGGPDSGPGSSPGSRSERVGRRRLGG